jgi:hypothetical protein
MLNQVKEPLAVYADWFDDVRALVRIESTLVVFDAEVAVARQQHCLGIECRCVDSQYVFAACEKGVLAAWILSVCIELTRRNGRDLL